MSIIKTHKICKSYLKVQFNPQDILHLSRNGKKAVENLSIEIEEGELVGFLGPNGAGKTTFLKILAGIIHPTSGEAKILGFTPWQRKYDYLRQIALVMGQKNQLWWDLPAQDSFNLLREVYQIPMDKYKHNLNMMVDTLGMQNLINQRLRNMSLGERMKCELTACFLHDPKVIFLDEPTIGLDVVSAQSIRAFIKKINQEKKCTIILTSHYMGDIEELCQRVIIINHGEMIYDGNFQALIEKYSPEKIIKVNLSDTAEQNIFNKIEYQKEIINGIGVIKVSKDDLGRLAAQVFDKFDPNKISITDPEAEEVISKIYQSGSNNL